MMKVLDLFSGIGGFSLGLEKTGGFETVAFCEIEEFPRKVLRKHWPDVPIFDDVRKLRGEDVGPVDVICGGYPCQPFSTAGQRRGAEDDRHLWPEFNRLVAELRPTWVIGENVSGHISMGLDDVLSDLEGQGYTARAFVIPACAVGAPHRRDRTWIVAHAQKLQRDGSGKHWEQSERQVPQFGKRGCKKNVVNAQKHRLERHGGFEETRKAGQDQPAKSIDEASGFAISGDPDRAIMHKLPSNKHNSDAGQSSVVNGQSGVMAHATGQRQSGQGKPSKRGGKAEDGKGQANFSFAISKPREWCPEPDVGRVANGVPRRVDRLKALGNAVVPQIPEMIGYAILEAVK